MKTIIVSALVVTLAAFTSLSVAAEIPFNQAQFDTLRTAGKPVAIVFHADWCPTCRAQAPILKELLQSRELSQITLFVANFDTEAAMKRSLHVVNQSTIIVFKDGREVARSTGDTQQQSLSALLHHAISGS